MHGHLPSHARKTACASAVSAMLLAGLNTSYAQEDDELDAEEADAARGRDVSDEITVTGTRIRRDDYTAANATTVVTGDDMRNLGVFSVADMIAQLPNNVAAITPETSANDNFNMGATIANLRGLNTYAGTRTLTLVDSRRFVPSNNGGGVDLNLIPTALVGRIETVTGGASATYGADAMAGVVNVILDNDIEGLRLDLSYDVTDEGDGENYNLSVGTGYQLFDGRGQFTLGYDHSDQEGIFDCTTREFCRASRAIVRNGTAPSTFFNPAAPYDPRNNIILSGQPEWVVLEGMRYQLLPEGVLWGHEAQFDQPAGTTSPADLTAGVYRLNAAGTDVVPYLDGLTAEQRALAFAEGVRQDTPWGEGALTYRNLSLRPENVRDNLYTRFAYEFERGIELNASLTYGESESLSLQNSARQTQYTGCILPEYAFLDPAAGATQRLIDVMRARRIPNSLAYTSEGAHSLDFSDSPGRAPNLNTPNPNDFLPGDGNCRPAPWIGTSFVNFDDANVLFDFPRNGGTFIHKDLSPWVNRSNTAKTETTSFTVGVSGDLFREGSWTWDVYTNVGKTDREAIITDWQSENRLEMSLYSVWDDVLGIPLCAVDPRREQTDPAHYALVEAKWYEYLVQALQDEAYVNGDPNGEIDYAVIDAYYENLRAGCAPINLLGSDPGPGEAALAYAFPDMKEGTENTQRALSVTFSGEAWEGIGAGPLRMAAGIDWRENDTKNLAAENVYTARDLVGVGTPGGPAAGNNLDIFLNFGDNWSGRTKTAEAFVEFELPVVRDRAGADYLMLNVANRRTKNETTRLGGTSEVNTQTVTRYNDSWKASMVWQPFDLLRVRLTRSADTRAPAANELFQTNSPAANTGAMSEVLNRFRFNTCDDPTELPADLSDPANTCLVSGNTNNWEQFDLAEAFAGANSLLDVERSVTETLGVVLTPAAVRGLQVSADYYETRVQGGIEPVNRFAILQGCGNGVFEQIGEGKFPWDYSADELLGFAQNVWYCDNIDFGVPDTDPSQLYPTGAPNPFSNILSVATSNQNVAPYWSRGIDFSASYFTQLSGGGSLSARVIATRFLEQSVETEGVFGRINAAGQTGSNGLNRENFNLGTNYSPTPDLSGNMFFTYQKNAFSLTGQVRYVGTGKLYVQEGWISEGEVGYPNEDGTGGTPYAWDRSNTVSDSTLPSWTTLNLNFSYDFSSSRLPLNRFQSLSVYLNIENVGDRVPDFFSGTGPGGVNTIFFSGIGREYRMGVRMQF